MDEDAKLAAHIEVLRDLTDEERLEVFAAFCTRCGSDDPSCQCWNDE